MIYYVSMMQSDVPFPFDSIFSEGDAFAIIGARVGQRIDLEHGAFGTLLEDGDFGLTTRSHGGYRLQSLDHKELCRQLSTPQDNECEDESAE